MARFNAYTNATTIRRGAWRECQIIVRIGALAYEADIYGPEFFAPGNPLPQREYRKTKRFGDHAEAVQWAQYQQPGDLIIDGWA